MTFKILPLFIAILVFLACESEINKNSLEIPANRDKLLIQSYLKENDIEAEEHSSGYFYRTLTASDTLLQVKNLDTVSVHYKGRVLYGDAFDNSRNASSAFKFTVGVGQVIRGWDLALPGMKVGQKNEYYFPSALGYGNVGNGNFIPPNSVLVFEIEVISIIF